MKNRVLKFGIEIEFFGRQRRYISDLLNNHSILCQCGYYPESHPHYWSLVRDGSVSKESNELVSPILYGPEGLAVVAQVLDLMKNNGCKVNYTCGIHIHHDIKDFSLLDIKNLCLFYYEYQDVFDNLMTKKRLIYNRYCKPFNASEICTIIQSSNLQKMLDSFTRYKALNIHSYPKYGTIEFRQHYGCLDSKEIINWIILTYKCVNLVKNEEVQLIKYMKLEDKLKLFKQLLDIENTCLDSYIDNKKRFVLF